MGIDWIVTWMFAKEPQGKAVNDIKPNKQINQINEIDKNTNEMVEIEKTRKRYCKYLNYWDKAMCDDLNPKLKKTISTSNIESSH